MDKPRLEALSDGIFAIVMTLLIFNVKLPTVAVNTIITSPHLWYVLGLQWPLFFAYILSFLVLSSFWINHHFLFHTFAKKINRQLNLMNMVYLMFLAFVPFSSQLLGQYTLSQPALLVYGGNLLLITVLSAIMQRYVRTHPDLRNENLSSRLVKQGRIRITLSMISYILGLAVSFVYPPLSIALYLFPIFFNIIPGTLDFALRVFRLELT